MSATPDSIVSTSTAATYRPSIVQRHHSKKRFDMHIVKLGVRTDRAEYIRIRNHAESLGGWYSRQYRSSPAGFAFKALADAESFVRFLRPTQAKPQPKPATLAEPETQSTFANLMDRRANWQPNTDIDLSMASFTKIPAEQQRAQPDPGKVYRLIGKADQPSIARGDNLADSVVDEPKPATPQETPMPSMTPLGLKDAPKQEKKTVNVTDGPGALSALVAQLS